LRGAQRFVLLQENVVVTTRPVRVLVVDDSAFARKIVREVLSSQEGLEVVGIARDGLDALERIAELAPDVVTLDLVMPNLDGVGVLRALQAHAKPPAVVIVSMADE
jgi:two-component system chemotaxis response regulator CheB